MLESLKEVTKGQSGGGCACAPFTKTKTREGGGDKGRETSKEEGEDNQELDWGKFLKYNKSKKERKEMKLFKVDKREMM